MTHEELRAYFLKLRFDPAHHLGLGDIRLTLGQQDELIEALEPQEGAFCPVEKFCTETPVCPWPCKKLKRTDAASLPDSQEGK